MEVVLLKTIKPSSSEAGVSLLELLTALALTSILALIAALNLPAVMDSFKRNDARQQVFFDIKRAKSEAAAAGARVVLSIDTSGSSYALGYDYFPFDPGFAMDSQIFMRNLPQNITVSATQPLAFDPRGYLIDSAGDLTTTTLSLNFDGETFDSVTVYPTGYLGG